MVEGFATGLEAGETRLFPGKLTVYRKFQFLPRAQYCSPDGSSEWIKYAGNTPPTYWEDFPVCQEKAKLYDRAYMDSIYGAPRWKPVLTGTTQSHIAYGPGEHTAHCELLTCQKSRHAAPCETCGCGFWAYYDVKDTGNIGRSDIGTAVLTVLAAVDVWGTVIRGTKGVRAEKMQIVGVQEPVGFFDWSRNGLGRAIDAAWNGLRQELGVPQYTTVRDLVAAHPPQGIPDAAKGISPEPTVPLPGCGCNLCAQWGVPPGVRPKQWTRPTSGPPSYWV
jgi:hypothetical protein